ERPAGWSGRSAVAAEAIQGDSGVVVRERTREAVTPLVTRGDEVEIVDGGRVRRGLDRGQAGAGDRAGRQARATIRIERRVREQVVARQALPILSHAVLHGGVRLERHLELEAVP